MVAIQETHDDGIIDDEYLKKLLRGHFRIFKSSIGSAAGGVLTMIADEYLAQFGFVYDHTVVPGRILAIHLQSEICKIVFVNIHLHVEAGAENAKIAMLKKLRTYLDDFRDWRVFIMGDFNFVENLTDRTSLNDGVSCGKRCGVAK